MFSWKNIHNLTSIFSHTQRCDSSLTFIAQKYRSLACDFLNLLLIHTNELKYFHGGVDEVSVLLGCNAVSNPRRTNTSPPHP